jgi:hypothetical protein
VNLNGTANFVMQSLYLLYITLPMFLILLYIKKNIQLYYKFWRYFTGTKPVGIATFNQELNALESPSYLELYFSCFLLCMCMFVLICIYLCT